MKSNAKKVTAAMLSAAMYMGAAAPCSVSAEEKVISLSDAVKTLEDGVSISNESISDNSYKNTRYNNPISSEFYCADPTAVEYNGRLYLFGTNDHEQYEIKGPELDNTYEQIKSLVILSTDDMVNWVYHGEINVGEVAPWIVNSWAPSIVSRVEDDGLTHFYLYFSNNGMGTGVITATDPLGPWSDPLGKPLISSNTPGLTDCPNPFDPGVVIDDNGVGWLSFGGGKASDGTTYMPGSSRIVQLGDDMLSFASDFAEIPAPYFFEASELNYINGTYIYTYNSDWSDHAEQWEYDCPAPSGCSMVYLTTKTPLDPTSWEMRGEYFQNPGVSGFDYSNNHTHLHKFNGAYYIFYHTLELKQGMGINGSYRSLCVDEINVDEETVTFEKTGGTKKGLSACVAISPFVENEAADLNNTADIVFDTTDMHHPTVMSDGMGAWFSVKEVAFTASETTETPVNPEDFSLTAIDSITYNIIVTDVDKATTVSMHPTTKDGTACTGSVEINGTGNYSITCDMGGADMLQNMGFFTATDDATITFVIDTMVINNKYSFDLSVELTNNREWADGLKNIWNGFADGDKLYTSEYADIKYIAADDAIEMFASPVVGGDNSSAPVLDTPVTFAASVKGAGTVEVRLDEPTGELLTTISFDSTDAFVTVTNDVVAEIGGTHDLYFVFSHTGMTMHAWQFVKETGDITPDPDPTPSVTLAGDVNEDGVVKIDDVILLNRLLAEDSSITVTDQGIANGDCDGKAGLDGGDSTAILRRLAGLAD